MFKKNLLVVILLLCVVSIAWPAAHVKATPGTQEVTIYWNCAVDADGYRLYKSTDGGVTWTQLVDIDNGTICQYGYTARYEDGLTLLKVSAYNRNMESFVINRGCWINLQWSQPTFPAQPQLRVE